MINNSNGILVEPKDVEALLNAIKQIITGEVKFEDNIKYRPTWDEFEWFKYNYCLIGKPQRIVIHECDKSSL